MKPKNIIIVNKKTFYEFCFLCKPGIPAGERKRFSAKDIALFKDMHFSHQRTLSEVRRVLRKFKVSYRVSNRKAHIPYDRYDFVITVGGDGTFLQAAGHLKNQLILGVNSDAKRSVGNFCAGNEKNFENIFGRIMSGKFPLTELPRLLLNVSENKKNFYILNDILVCDINPAAMSRYVIDVAGKSEEQRSSGVWVAAASGSTGAIRSSGGILIDRTSKKIQYRPRELYARSGKRYRLTGQALFLEKPLKIRSLMRKGVIYVDGAHTKVPFAYGQVAVIRHARLPIRTFL